jgi:hypothetical protein
MLWVLFGTLGLFALTTAAVFLASKGKLRLRPHHIDALAIAMVVEACSILVLMFAVDDHFPKQFGDDGSQRLEEIGLAEDALIGTAWKVKLSDRRCAVQFLDDGRIGKPGSPGEVRPDARWRLTSPSNIVLTAYSNSLVLRGKLCKGRMRGVATNKTEQDSCTWSAEKLQ